MATVVWLLHVEPRRNAVTGRARNVAKYNFPASPPKEALGWFTAKGYKPAFDYRDVWREEHNYAFTVAKAMHVDVLTSIKGALDDSLANGKTFESFKKDIQPTLEKLGWWGQTEMKDPLTGEVRTVQLGSPRRLEIIYRTNMETARQAGQWERIQRNKATHPYLVYELGPSREHRHDHASWAGTVLPVDDLWWSTHRPKNGWGCKCTTRAVSKREFGRMSSDQNYKTTAPEIKYREWINKRTGEVERVPVGIDPGWDYNPGANGERAQQLNKHLSDANKAFTNAMAVPVKRNNMVMQPGNDLLFTTSQGINEVAIEDVLRAVPGAQPQIDKLAEFMQSKPVKSIFIKEPEMGEKNKAAQKIQDNVKQFLGDTWSHNSLRAFTTSRHKRTNGFTSSYGSHVVIKVPAKVDLRKVDPNKMAKAVERAIQIDGSPTERMPWTFRRIFDDISPGDDTGFLITWLHEVGHQIHFKSGLTRRIRFDSLTEYGASSNVEWHAEHIAAWLLNRDALLKWNPEVTKYIDDLIESAIKKQ